MTPTLRTVKLFSKDPLFVERDATLRTSGRGINMVEGIVQRAAQGEAIEPALVTILESSRFDCLEKFMSEEIVAEKMAVFEAEVEAQGRELVVPEKGGWRLFIIIDNIIDSVDKD